MAEHVGRDQEPVAKANDPGGGEPTVLGSENPSPEREETTFPKSGAFRRFVSNPAYLKLSPWLALAKRFGPVVTLLTLLVSGISAVISGANWLQSHDIYVRSLQPVLDLELTKTANNTYELSILNPSGADAHDLHVGCTRIAARPTIASDFPIVENEASLLLPRNRTYTEPINTNCPEFVSGPMPARYEYASTTILPVFVCYADEVGKAHAVVQLFQYPGPNGVGYYVQPKSFPIFQALLIAAHRQCGAEPQNS